MAKGDKPSYEVGRGKPPRKTRFEPGKSGNPKGRPKGSKNFATVLEKELNVKIPISENGLHKRITKREAIAKQIVNKATGGDMKATQALMKEDRDSDGPVTPGIDLSALDTPDRPDVVAELIRRIRAPDWESAIDPPAAVPGLENFKPSSKRKGKKT